MRGSRHAVVPIDHQRLIDWLGARLRQIRGEKGLSQGELAVLVGLSCQQIAKYECGQNAPTITRLVQICIALNVHFEVLASEIVQFYCNEKANLDFYASKVEWARRQSLNELLLSGPDAPEV